MKQRTISSIVIILLLVPLVLFSKYIVYPIVLGILSLMATFELFRVIGCEKKYALAIPAYLISAASPILAFFVDKSSQISYILMVFGALLVYLLYSMGNSIFSKGKTPISKMAEVYFTLSYVTLGFSALSLLRFFDREVGLFNVGLVFVVSWICDVGAYLVGSLIGRHKLIPEISPKKTVEGSIGGIVFAGLCFIIYGFCIELIGPDVKVNYLLLMLFGAVLSVVSQLGDLAASLIKREYGVKDYSNLIPGHGGIMDRFDSVLPVSLGLLVLCELYPPFVFVG